MFLCQSTAGDKVCIGGSYQSVLDNNHKKSNLVPVGLYYSNVATVVAIKASGYGYTTDDC